MMESKNFFVFLCHQKNKMKINLAVPVIAVNLFFISCASTDSQKENAGKNAESASPSAAQIMPTETQQPAQPESSNPEAPSQPVVSAAPVNTVFHYICPNKCAGGGSEGQGKCPVCKTDLVHNDAFHSQPQQQPQIKTQPQNNPVQLNTNTQAQQPPPQPDAPQNAKGVWHYTCPKGCAGGGGQAIACSNCGTQLEHNQKYHE